MVMVSYLVMCAFVAAGLGGPTPQGGPGPPTTLGPCQPPVATFEPPEHFVDFSVSHALFAADVLVANIEYKVMLAKNKPGPVIAFTIQSFIDDVPEGKFINRKHECGHHVLKGELDVSPVAVNWTAEHFSRESNVTFEVNYQIDGDAAVYRLTHFVPVTPDCQVHLRLEEALVTSADVPSECQVWFPGHAAGHGLVVELTRLNVPCSRGYIHFSGLNVSQHLRSHRQSRICGKLEELPETDRHVYFPFSHTLPFVHLHGKPVFSLGYHLVDYCYNVTFTARNGSFALKPSGDLQCTFRIFLPYGNRVALSLQIGDSTSTGTPGTDSMVPDSIREDQCDGLLTHLQDGDSTWSHCTKSGDAERRIEVLSHANRVVLRVGVQRSGGGALGLTLEYRAVPVEEVVGLCAFGWVALNQFCVSAVEEARLPWVQAEAECGRRGGHLASVRNEHAQTIIDNLLNNSPGYRANNAYWIGASDKIVEGDFRWSDGLPFSFTNWFPGWPQHGHYNRQPNDDGLSEQDCVEVRRSYSLMPPSGSSSLASVFMWNDRDCSTANYFICERLRNDEPLEDNWPPDCNHSVELSRQLPRAAVSSPGFPRQYPDNANCSTEITAPSGYRLVLDFEELVLEKEPSCSYDYLEIFENDNGTIFSSSSSSPSINSSSSSVRRLCGDWSSKLKLLRYVSRGSRLKLRFSSDYSHHFGGYKARISMESAIECADDRLHMFNNSCYLFVSYPEVTWQTAQQICKGKKSQLASISNPEEERFVTTNIRKSPEYRTSALYWLGGKMADQDSHFRWADGTAMEYTEWLPGQKPLNASSNMDQCLSIQWTPSPTPMLPSGLYWRAHKCSNIGGFVCKRPSQSVGAGLNFNRTVNGSEGNLTTPHYPDNYYNNLDFAVRIVGPERTRIVIEFARIDVEPQLECLYDFVEVRSVGARRADQVKLCGSHDTNMSRFNFVSESNEAELRFHSDYSISGSGFSLFWRAIDVSSCPKQTLTAREGILHSPNYPDSLLDHLDCTYIVLAPMGKRIWIDFLYYKDVILNLNLGEQSDFQPFTTPQDLLSEGSFVSRGEKLTIHLRTAEKPIGRGFKAVYKIVNNPTTEERIIQLDHNSSGSLLHLNYPSDPPLNTDFTMRFIAPIGSIITLDLFHVKLLTADGFTCPDDSGAIEVKDHYYDFNGTAWRLCYDEIEPQDSIVPVNPISITSYLHTLSLRQRSGVLGAFLNGSLRVLPDHEFKGKLLGHRDGQVDSCGPNPCLNGGKCVSKGPRKFCKCTGHFTGIFCSLTKCELEPCVFGTCELTNTSYNCHCKSGYAGPTCEQKRSPCEGNPCESRGRCIERGDGFQCRCHAWWEGTRCEKRMQHIPYKPLSERMFHEPFWLGLMTVFVVMAVIGLVWCAKRHFPEKIEKLLAEESERNRSHIPYSVSSLRSSSVREQLAMASAAPTSTTVSAPSPGPAAPRTLFGRLGIRKPSILSLTSPHASGYAPAATRTFSLDDLLKPLSRRTPSPKKKRNNSTPTKKNVAEKKQILQQLISPGGKQLSRKVSLGELIQMSERVDPQRKESAVNETRFVDDPGGGGAQAALSDPKLEKKVTFARLLSKVSAEMSSGSDMEMGLMHGGRLGCVFARPASTPPSPHTDARSPNSTSSNQDLLGSNRLPGGRLKPASADSILAMFRNFSSSSAGVNLPSSLRVSPSTTPTASSPQDDVVGDDESSTSSSLPTPVSYSSGPPESPVMHRHHISTIEVPVLDPLSAHKTSGSNFLHPPTILLEIPSTINKCLSPIREMPTPLPSPLPSPMPFMRRKNFTCSTASSSDLSDERICVEVPAVCVSEDDDVGVCCARGVDLHAEDGLILEEAAAMHQNSTKNKIRPPPLEHPQPLVIPMLTIQTPSPTHSTPHFLGSPPPHKAMDHFQFPPPKQYPRKLYKDLDKPCSLDLPCVPPMITITCNMSEADSDADSISPAANNKNSGHLGPTSGMTYLSPFSMGARGEHNASESNLSSSGYSSMASPGPSRCGSSNPLCPSEMEDQGGPGSGSGGGGNNSHGGGRRPSPVLKAAGCEKNAETEEHQGRGRSDSETLSDDPLLESNDEGIGTDHIDEKIEDGDVRSAKELQVFMDNSDFSDVSLKLEVPCLAPPKVTISLEDNIERLLPPPPNSSSKKTLQLPSIVVQCDEKRALSPMSSRSESPLSDRTSGLGRFSPHFYGRNKDILPFTDSDGLYDFPSSDKVNVLSNNCKKTSRRREKKSTTRNCKTPSPTKTTGVLLYNHLDVPSKDSCYKVPPPRKLSPKRRATRSQVVSSSSSSDSIISAREIRLTSSSPSPDTIRWSSPISWLGDKKLDEPDDVDNAHSAMLPRSSSIDSSNKNQKISKLRAISHQIRFLRRLEQSLKRRERTITPSDSPDSGEDESPRATSPLLHQKAPKLDIIRKSNSIGKINSNRLQSNSGNGTSRNNRRGRYKRDELLIPEQDERSWKRIVITGNGHSD